MKILFAVSCLLLTAASDAAAPLFESNDTIALTIEAPMRDLIRKRRDKPEFDATITYTDARGESRTVSAKIRTRGHHRLETCGFPPIRLEFGEDAAAGTLFEGQRRIKMVTQCDRGYDYEAWLLQEHGIYRAYNEITDFSFRVRRLDVTYQDDESKRWKRRYPAFFIESDDALAARSGFRSIRPPSVRPDQFDEAGVTNALLFQYLIGNTDFAVLRGPTGEGCCHNGRIIAPPGREHGWVFIPYDFDQAGVINTDYALPDRRLPIRNVRSRLYRGFCWNSAALPDAIALFNDRRAAITAALTPTEISSTRQRRIRQYIERFYEIVNDPAELQEEILDKCRGAATFEIRASTSAGQ